MNVKYYQQILEVKDKEIYDLKKEIQSLRIILIDHGELIIKLRLLEEVARRCDCE